MFRKFDEDSQTLLGIKISILHQIIYFKMFRRSKI